MDKGMKKECMKILEEICNIRGGGGIVTKKVLRLGRR